MEGLIATKQPQSYDQAVTLLVALRDLAARKHEASFQQRVEELRAAHARKPTLIDRLQKAGLCTPTATCAGIVLGRYRFGSSTASRSRTARRSESIGGDIAGTSPARQDLMLDTKRWPFDDFSQCVKVR